MAFLQAAILVFAVHFLNAITIAGVLAFSYCTVPAKVLLWVFCGFRGARELLLLRWVSCGGARRQTPDAAVGAPLFVCLFACLFVCLFVCFIASQHTLQQ